MKEDLYKIQDSYGFRFEVHDLDAFEGGNVKYGDLVPVLLWGQDVICYHSLDATLLARALGIDPPAAPTA